MGAKFKTAITNNNWEAATAAYFSHSDYATDPDFKCYESDRNDLCKRFKFNAKQFRTMVKKTGRGSTYTLLGELNTFTL